MRGLPSVVLWALLLASGFATSDARAQSASSCDRACLRGFIDGYFEALANRDPERLPLADDVKYTENGRVLALGEGFWRTAGEPTRYRDYLIDPESGGAAVLTGVLEHGVIAPMFLRLKVEDRRIAEIETFVVRAGHHRWFAPENLERLSDIFNEPVPATERHSREELIAAAEAYFDAIETEGTPAFVQAPFAPGMKRIENGLQTTNVTENPIVDRHTWSADLQLERASYAGTNVRDRRYPVVDEEQGSVLAVATFRREGDHTPTLFLAETFKFTSGQLREIRAVILNVPNGAGLGWDADPNYN